MDENKAYILGMLHDIGRRVGIVNIPKHVYEGYRYSVEKGWDEVAKICMTHSYPLMKEEFDHEPNTEEEKVIKEYISKCYVDDYDKLIQQPISIFGKRMCRKSLWFVMISNSIF